MKSIIDTLETFAKAARLDESLGDAKRQAATDFLNQVVFSSEGRPVDLQASALRFVGEMFKDNSGMYEKEDFLPCPDDDGDNEEVEGMDDIERLDYLDYFED